MKKIQFLIPMFLLTTVSQAHWSDNQVEKLTNYGVLQEIFETQSITNILDRNITREEFFSFVAVAKDLLGEESSKNFEDMKDVNPKFQKYIGQLVNQEIIVGSLHEDKVLLYPKQKITRQEVAVVLSKILELPEDNKNIIFSDSNQIGDWAATYMKNVVGAKIINGYEDNTLRPQNNITIAETIALISNTYDKGYFSKGKIEIYAGTGEKSLKNQERQEATFNSPHGIAIKNNSLYVADRKNNAIRIIEKDKVFVIAGREIGVDEYNESIGSFEDGKKALFDNPTSVITLENGLLIADQNNNLIRFINKDGYVTTFAGQLESGLVNGKVDKAKFNNPTAIAIDSNGNIYITDTGNNVIRKIDTNQNVTTFAGKKTKGGYKDGNLAEAEFNSPMGITIVNDVIYIADSGNQRIRMIKDGKVSTYAGNGIEKDDFGLEIIGDFIDGDKNTAKFNFPVNLVADNDGNLYIADNGNSAIRKIDTNGNVSTVMKNEIKRPFGLAIEENELYVSDMMLNKIFKIKL